MALRLVQVHAAAATERVGEAMASGKPVWHKPIQGADGTVRHDALVEVGHEQDLLDRLQTALQGDAEGRIVILPVETTLPRNDEAAAPEAAPTPTARPGRLSREELYDDLGAAAKLSWTYLVTVLLSIAVVTIGLVRSSPAVVIGGMVIAPLLGPNIALGLAAALADRKLALRALQTNLVGLGVGLGIALLVGAIWGVRLDEDGAIWSPEIRSRTEPRDVDLLLALAAGVAGTMAFTTQMASSLVGVMVAVALMPPLVVFGMCAGAGMWDESRGALILLLANVVCVNLAAVLTFLAQAITPRNWWDVRRSRRVVRVVALGLLVALAAVTVLTFLEMG